MAGLFLALPYFFVSAQSDGSASPITDTGASGTGAPAPVPVQTTAAPIEAAPRVAPTTDTAIATSAPATVAPVAPRGTPRKVAPVVSTPPAPKSQTNQISQIPVVPPSQPIPTENPNPFPYSLVALAVLFVLAPYGMVRMLSRSKSNEKTDKNEDKGNRCDQIKQLLERKKSTLEIISGTISTKQVLVDFLVKKIEAKEEELKDEIKEEIIDKAAGEKGGKIIRSVKEAKEIYDELVEKLEQVKLALEYFMNRRKQLREDVEKIESAYHTCLLGNSVFAGASRLGAGLELFEASLHQKLYRHTSDKKDVFGKIPPEDFRKEAEEAGKWLLCPELPPGEYRFFLTEKGKEEYEKTLLPVHKKYLSDISCDETDSSKLDTVAYEDEWQVVVKNEAKAPAV